MRFLAAMLRRLRGQGTAASMMRVVAMRSLALAVNMLTGLLTAALLGPEGRGEQAAMIVAPQFLAGLSSLGLHAALIYNIKHDPAAERDYLGTSLAILFATSTVSAMIGFAIMPYWLHNYSSHTLLLARVFLCTAPLSAVSWGMMGAAEARGWFAFANRTLYLQSIGILLALGLLILLKQTTPGKTAAIYVFSTVPVFLYFVWFVGRKIRPRFTLRAPVPRRLLNYGLRFYGIDLMSTFAAYFDQIFIVWLLAPGLLGAYVVAKSIAGTLTVLQGAVSSVLFPTVAAQPKAVVLETVAMTVRVTGAVNAAAALSIGVLCPYLLALAYGDKFASAIAPLRVLLVNSMVNNAARMLYQVYAASGRPEIVTAFEAAGTATSLLAMVVLVPSFGVMGAAYSVLLASAVRLGFGLAGLPLVLHVPIPRLILGWSDLRSFARG